VCIAFRVIAVGHFRKTELLMSHFRFLSIVLAIFATGTDAILTEKLGVTKPCHADENQPCEIDGYVGSNVIYEDDLVRVWNLTLASGEITSMHAHDFAYHFVAIKPTQLEVYGANGDRLFDFRAEGVLGFKVIGEFLVPQNIELPWPVPRIHAAKNIGNETYYEILYESKVSTDASVAEGGGSEGKTAVRGARSSITRPGTP
jgi:hypothetical protein